MFSDILEIIFPPVGATVYIPTLKEYGVLDSICYAPDEGYDDPIAVVKIEDGRWTSLSAHQLRAVGNA